ncbi:hypothetical protein GJ744_004207 [Endocarpon pusillum]|uniref:Uncharacterized protein n=1 Tax=Endocarpon pusillum TaxID=364733 RepID=A0A8H7A879_9EURO|nr:hypothetical protein GJ744_004207 [Endocarpon pusillum]
MAAIYYDDPGLPRDLLIADLVVIVNLVRLPSSMVELNNSTPTFAACRFGFAAMLASGYMVNNESKRLDSQAKWVSICRILVKLIARVMSARARQETERERRSSGLGGRCHMQ